MNLLLRLACLQLALVDPPAQAPQPAQQPSPIDLVSALENVVSDAIARAEPSVVAIHREKGDNPQETQAVRGRKRPGAAFEPGRRGLDSVASSTLPTRSRSISARASWSGTRDRS